MQKASLYLLVLGAVCISVSCNKSNTTTTAEDTGNWIKRSEFEGSQRTNAASFVIGDFAYIGGGYDGTARLNDFWKFDPTGNGSWRQVADFTGTARSNAVGFAVGNVGYITTGNDGNVKLKDNWAYDATANAWTKKGDFPGAARYDAVAFAINGKGYITTGYGDNTSGGSSNLKDIWEYNPAGDAWTQKTSLGGDKRTGASVFVYNNVAYVFAGMNNGYGVNDMWAYDPSNDSWTAKRKLSNVTDSTFDDDYTDITRAYAATFVIDKFGYLSTGQLVAPSSSTGGSSGISTKTWTYDFSTDTWSRRTAYEGKARTGAVGFTVKNRGFIATGGAGSSSFYDDIWELNPSETYNAND